MIHYKKLTDYQSEILSDGAMIGTLERLANEWYIIEIDYFSFPVSVDKKHLIHGLIERVYTRIKARDIKSLNRLRPHNEFKILE